MAAGDRLLEILDTFDLEHRALTVGEIAARVGQPQSSVYRSVRTLREAGYLDASDDGLYRLQPKLLRLAAIVRADNDMLRGARGPLQRLARAADQTAMLTVHSGRHAVCLDSVNSGRPIGILVPPGKLFPLHAGATGRVLLAFLTEQQRQEYYATGPLETFLDATTDTETLERELALVRERGYDLTLGQFEESLFSCAVPVRDPDGTVVATVSVVGIAHGPDELAGHQGLLPLLRATADEIAESL